MAFRAFVLSSAAIRASSSSSSENLRFSPRFASSARLAVSAAGMSFFIPFCEASPACVSSNSRTARSWASRSLRVCSSRASRSSCSRAFSARLISFFCARMLLSAHSRQNMSPWTQATGSIAGSKQRPQDAKGRNDSRERRAVEEPHDALARSRSYEVKTGRVVFLLPVQLACFATNLRNKMAYCVTC